MATKKSTKKNTGKPEGLTIATSLTVAKGSKLAELVEEGETFERKKVSAKEWRGLYLLNQPIAHKHVHGEENFHVKSAIKFISQLRCS